MVSIGLFRFELVLPFEWGGMDSSGFTVAPAVRQGSDPRHTESPPRLSV